MLLVCIIVIATIHFYNQFIRKTYEIGNIIHYCMLPAKLIALKVVVQRIPKDSFTIRHLPTILPCKIFQQVISVGSRRFVFIPHRHVNLQDYPLPSPLGEGQGVRLK